MGYDVGGSVKVKEMRLVQLDEISDKRAKSSKLSRGK